MESITRGVYFEFWPCKGCSLEGGGGGALGECVTDVSVMSVSLTKCERKSLFVMKNSGNAFFLSFLFSFFRQVRNQYLAFDFYFVFSSA